VIGAGYRNIRCPNCDSLSRERLIYFYLQYEANVFKKKNKTILHIAPEKNLGEFFKSLPNSNYTSADLYDPLAMVKMDITDLGFSENTFDVIVCNHVLEHVLDDFSAMSELYRILRPGGEAILQVPISLSLQETYEDQNIRAPQEREKAFGQNDHVRIYARDYKDRLEKAGFLVQIVDYGKKMGRRLIQRYGLESEERLYVCLKSGN
jgi:predicted SAM-dependent methyltransferase